MADAIQSKPKFRADMPKIPGVPDQPIREETAETPPGSGGLIARAAIVGAAVVFMSGAAWWAYRTTRSLPSQTETLQVEAAPAPAENPLPPLPTAASLQSNGPVKVGRVQELARPWSSKRFLFRKRTSSETVPPLVVRLPGGGSNSEGRYWGFSLQAPYGRCELELVTDLNRLASQYGYKSRYPMVGDPCTGTVYDPLRLGTAPGGAWVRGEIVSGAGLRPPIAIEIRVRGNQLVATQIE